MSGRKKTWVKSAFDQLNDIVAKSTGSPSGTVKKKRKLDSTAPLQTKAPPINAETSTNKNSSNWMDSFAPNSTEDLAVQGKKIEELENWLHQSEKKRQKIRAPICLLTGPTGCGKTATIRVLAQKCGYHLREWVNPVDREMVQRLGDQREGDAYMISQLDAYKSFLLRASRYKSLLQTHNKNLLLVEDFPNALISDTSAFEAILDEYVIYGMSPLIFIVADSKSRGLNISYNLFSEQMKSKFMIQHFSFNPIAVTLMNKAMKRFCSIMRQQADSLYKVPAQTIIDSIAVSAQGDIRNALVNLHFASLKGSPAVLTVPLEHETRKSKKQSSLKSIGRDQSVTMFHALGRVLNPKFKADGAFLHKPEEISENFASEPQRFIDFLHANYLGHYGNISSVCTAIDALSVADTVLNEYRESALAASGLNIGVRGVMVANDEPVTGWMPVRAPKRTHKSSLLQGSDSFQLLGHYVSKSLYVSDYSTFVECILKTTPNKIVPV